MSVGDRIAAIMKEQGISQNRLAKMAQISQSGLSSIISGAVSPKENTLQSIAKALGTDVPNLLGVESQDKWELSENVRSDPEYRILLGQIKKAKPEHIRAAVAMLKSLEESNVD